MSNALRPFLIVFAILALASPLTGQQPPLDDQTLTPVIQISDQTVFLGLSAVGSGFTAPSTVSWLAATAAAPVIQERRASHNVALMIVGGAGLIVGALVDGDAGTVIMIGGGAVALVGLYRYVT